MFQKKYEKNFKHFLAIFLTDFRKKLFCQIFHGFYTFQRGVFLEKNRVSKMAKICKKRHAHLHRPNLKNRRKVAGPVWIRDPRPNPVPGGSFSRLSRAHFFSELKCLSPLKTSGL